MGVAGHCNIGDGVIVTAQSGTHGDIPAGSMVSGSPAFDHKQWLRAVGIFSKLPEFAKAMRALKAKRSTEPTPLRKRNDGHLAMTAVQVFVRGNLAWAATSSNVSCF